MLIEADVKPKNLKRGVTRKKFCQAMGFKEEVGLSQLCGMLSLSGESPQEFAFLTALNEAVYPHNGDSSEVVIMKNGVKVLSFIHEASEHL